MVCPPISGVVESILYFDDLPRAIAFYSDVMGLMPIAGDAERFRAFDSGAGRVLLLFKRGATLAPTRVTGGIIPPHDGGGPLHIGFAISAADYDVWRQRLLDLRISIESEALWTKGGRSIYFRDTEGHLLELITPGIWSVY
jgi:catechol 2,3-dioxygenase-like lactoylglutathione lyase family enzyme